MADSDEHPQKPQQEVCNFFKKPSKGKNIRKRPTIEEGENEDEDSKTNSSVNYNKKKQALTNNKLYFSTGSSKHSVEPEVDLKAPLFQFESSREIQVRNDSKATATLETETEFSKDARAIRERVLKQAEKGLKEKSTSDGDEKLYKGIHGYTDYKAGFQESKLLLLRKLVEHMDLLELLHTFEVSARFDYQPDICKDYKETGYCGYGDACKFMHDRGDYKSGWQIEREWEEAEKTRKRNLAMGIDDDDEGAPERSDEDEDDSLPFACFICRQPFVDPVVTKCKHYFCEHCALKHHARNKKCFVCNQPTNGIFNTAFEIRKKMSAEGK